MASPQHKNDDEEYLFHPRILEHVSIPNVEGLIIRPLKSGDNDKGFIALLGQLTEVGSIDEEQFLARFHSMKKAGGYYVIIIEDLDKNQVIGCSTLVVEQKFIHNCTQRGRLEDVVVNSEYRGKQLGKILVKVLIQLSSYLNCYKLSLDCKDRLVPFYESLGFKRETGNANCLNMRFPRENANEQSHL